MKSRNLNKKSMGERIKQIRGELTMQSFADIIGVKSGTLNNYEKGRYVPSNSVLEKIIEQSNSYKSINEILYGDTYEYLEYIFRDIEELKKVGVHEDGSPDYGNYDELMHRLWRALVKNKIQYEDEKQILELVRFSSNEFVTLPGYIALRKEFGLPPITFTIEERMDYRSYILPVLERNLYLTFKLERYQNLFDRLSEIINIFDLNIKELNEEHLIKEKKQNISNEFLISEFDIEEIGLKEFRENNYAYNARAVFNILDELDEKMPYDISLILDDYLKIIKKQKLD